MTGNYCTWFNGYRHHSTSVVFCFYFGIINVDNICAHISMLVFVLELGLFSIRSPHRISLICHLHLLLLYFMHHMVLLTSLRLHFPGLYFGNYGLSILRSWLVYVPSSFRRIFLSCFMFLKLHFNIGSPIVQYLNQSFFFIFFYCRVVG